MRRRQQNDESGLLPKEKQRKKRYRTTRYLVSTVVSG